MKSKILVFIQFLIIFLMLLPFGKTIGFLGVGIFFVIVGLSIGFMALSKNRVGNFNIRPDIKESCVLITDGIYKYIRHPMYSSVIVTMLGVLVLNFTLLTLILYILLVINMLVKMFYEESLWKSDRAEYLEYEKKTSRLIAFIF